MTSKLLQPRLLGRTKLAFSGRVPSKRDLMIGRKPLPDYCCAIYRILMTTKK